MEQQSGATITAASGTNRVCYLVDAAVDGCIDFIDDASGTYNLQRVGYPVGYPCTDLDPNGEQCPASGTTTTGSCPTGCNYAGVTCSNTTGSPVSATGGSCGTAGTTSVAINVQCNSSGQCT